MIRGLSILPHFVTENEAEFIVAELDGPRTKDLSQEPGSRWSQQGESRPAQHFGARYDYACRSLAQADPIPTWILPLCYRLRSSGTFEAIPDQIIANNYDGVDHGIDFHIDHQMCFGPVVASLSLISSTVITFRHGHKGGPSVPVLLEPRSLLILANEARYEWHHGIQSATVQNSIDLVVERKRRVSITFRTIESQAPRMDL